MASTTARTPYQVTYIVIAASVGAFALIQSLTIPVLSDLQRSFGTDQSTVTWVLTAYLLSASICTPIVGRLGDAVGKERMLVCSLGMLSLGSVLAAVAPNIWWLIAARAVQGIGGGVLPVSFGIIRDEFPEKRVRSAISIVSSLLAAGIGVGIVLAGPIAGSLGLSWLFWLPAIVTGAAAAAAFFLVPESPVRSPGGISLAPAVLLSSWLLALLIGISQAPKWGWTSPLVLGLFLAAAGLAALWIRSESRADVPLVDMRMMRRRAVWTSNLVAFLVGFGLYATSSFLPQFLQTLPSVGYGFGLDATQSGLVMLPSASTSFLVGLIAAPLALRIGSRTAVVCGCAVAGAAVVSLALLNEEIWQISLAWGFSGLGIGMAFACLANLVVAAVPVDQTGIATGMNANIRTIGGAIGSAVLASVVTAEHGVGSAPAESGYVHGFLLVGCSLVFAAIAALAIPSTPDRSERRLVAVSTEPEDVDTAPPTAPSGHRAAPAQ